MGLSPFLPPPLSSRCVTLLFVACAIYDPDEDYVGELRESGFGWPSCSFDAGWDDDEFCPSVFVGALAENLFETVWLTVLCAPIVTVLDRMLEAIGASERLRKQFQARASEIAAVGGDVLRALDTATLADLRRVEMEAAAVLDLVITSRGEQGASAAGEPIETASSDFEFEDAGMGGGAAAVVRDRRPARAQPRRRTARRSRRRCVNTSTLCSATRSRTRRMRGEAATRRRRGAARARDRAPTGHAAQRSRRRRRRRAAATRRAARRCTRGRDRSDARASGGREGRRRGAGASPARARSTRSSATAGTRSSSRG